MTWRPDLDSSHQEAAKVAHLLVPYTRGRGVDAGSGHHVVFPHFIRVDSGKDFGGQKVADIHADARDLSMFGERSLDFVFSSHFLEHVENPLAVLENWWSRIRVGGHLVLYLPHADHYPRIGQPGANPDHKADYVPEDVIKLMGMVVMRGGDGWMVRENEVRAQDDEYSFFVVFQKREDRRTLGTPWERNPDGRERCLVIRYGAIGDAIQTTSIFRALAERYHLTVNTTPLGEEVMRGNPHVAEWLVQDVDQVPNHLLPGYWERLAERYDVIINLSGSIEDGLLPHPERSVSYNWPDEARRRVFGRVNYLERLHDIACVPHEFDQRFYPGDDLVEAQRELRQIRGPQRRPVVLWALSGSGVHKSWPYVHQAVYGLMTYTDAAVVFVGDSGCTDLEDMVGQHLIEMAGEDPAALDDQPREALQVAMDRLHPGRIHFRSGAWALRHSLTMATLADVVIGPETGIVNASGMEDNATIVFLSHSSAENLVKHWRNVTALIGATPCYPCHRLHFGWSSCNRDEATGAAACAAMISPQRVVEAVVTALGQRQERAA